MTTTAPATGLGPTQFHTTFGGEEFARPGASHGAPKRVGSHPPSPNYNVATPHQAPSEHRFLRSDDRVASPSSDGDIGFASQAPLADGVTHGSYTDSVPADEPPIKHQRRLSQREMIDLFQKELYRTDRAQVQRHSFSPSNQTAAGQQAHGQHRLRDLEQQQLTVSQSEPASIAHQVPPSQALQYYPVVAPQTPPAVQQQQPPQQSGTLMQQMDADDVRMRTNMAWEQAMGFQTYHQRWE